MDVRIDLLGVRECARGLYLTLHTDTTTRAQGHSVSPSVSQLSQSASQSHLLRSGLPRLHQVRRPCRQHARLARARARHQQLRE